MIYCRANSNSKNPNLRNVMPVTFCDEHYIVNHQIFATTQLNPKLGRPYFPKKPHHNTTTNHPSLFLSSYTTKLDQIQYATLFQPIEDSFQKRLGNPTHPQTEIFKINSKQTFYTNPMGEPQPYVSATARFMTWSLEHKISH